MNSVQTRASKAENSLCPWEGGIHRKGKIRTWLSESCPEVLLVAHGREIAASGGVSEQETSLEG